jgi:hypothetical protein
MLGPLDVSFPTGFVQDYLNDLRAHGFTPDELVTFGQLGLTSDDIARILSDVLALDPLGVPAAFLSILDGEIAFNTTMASNLEPTPEPTTLLLFGTTAAGLALHRWRQRRTKQTAMDN